VGTVALSTVLFFVFSIVVGFGVYLLFKWMDKRWPHTRRLPIWSLALCFIMAYAAEKLFGIADITGAYVAGIILCSIQDHDYIAQKMDINSYMIFGPVFFASIGLRTDISNFNKEILLFSVLFVIVALVSKIVGCGLISKVLKFSWSDSLKIGVGMMTRGEVALIVSQKGLSVGLVSPEYFTAVILLIVVSSILTPILLKLLYAQESSRVHDVG
jgi:Kef-type K+ transport system membrane component KefB